MLSVADFNDPKTSQRWWRDAVIYQVYVRSFADADGSVVAVAEHVWIAIDPAGFG